MARPSLTGSPDLQAPAPQVGNSSPGGVPADNSASPPHQRPTVPKPPPSVSRTTENRGGLANVQTPLKVLYYFFRKEIIIFFSQSYLFLGRYFSIKVLLENNHKILRLMVTVYLEVLFSKYQFKNIIFLGTVVWWIKISSYSSTASSHKYNGKCNSSKNF